MIMEGSIYINYLDINKDSMGFRSSGHAPDCDKFLYSSTGVSLHQGDSDIISDNFKSIRELCKPNPFYHLLISPSLKALCVSLPVM